MINKQSKLRLRYIIKMFNTSKVGVTISCIAFVLTSAAGVISPILIRYIIDIAIVQNNIALCILYATLYLLCQLGTVVFGTLGLFFSEHTANKILCSQKNNILSNLLNIKSCSLGNKSPAELNLIINSYIDNTKFFFADFPRIIVELTMLLLGSISLIQFLNKYVLIFILGAIFINSLVYIVIKKSLENIAEEENNIQKKKVDWFQLLFNHIAEFTINCGWKNIQLESSKLISDSIDINNKSKNIEYISNTVSKVITMIITVLIYIMSNNIITIGTVLATLSFYNIILPIANTYIDMFKYYTLLSPSLDEIVNIDKMITEELNNPIKRIAANRKDGFVINRLTFRYNTQVILENANVTLPPKGIILLKAPNGKGKTTFAKIIMGLLNVEDGYTDIQQDQISYLPQNSALIPGSILFNITLDNNHIEPEMLNEYFNNMDIEEFIFNAKHDLNEFVSMDDNCFSGGERRKICILRSLWYARNKKIIILDEPEAGLDVESIKKITSIFNYFSKQKLIILLTHSKLFDDSGRQLTIINRSFLYEN